MKLTALLLIISFTLNAQLSLKKRVVIKTSLHFVSGALQGLHERNLHHPEQFNGKWFDPSGDNKYKPGTLEPRFKGSTTYLVVFTDFYHASKAAMFTTMAIGFSIPLYEKFKIKNKLIEAAGGLTIQKVGFFLTYNLIKI